MELKFCKSDVYFLNRRKKCVGGHLYFMLSVIKGGGFILNLPIFKNTSFATSEAFVCRKKDPTYHHWLFQCIVKNIFRVSFEFLTETNFQNK